MISIFTSSSSAVNFFSSFHTGLNPLLSITFVFNIPYDGRVLLWLVEISSTVTNGSTMSLSFDIFGNYDAPIILTVKLIDKG